MENMSKAHENIGLAYRSTSTRLQGYSVLIQTGLDVSIFNFCGKSSMSANS